MMKKILLAASLMSMSFITTAQKAGETALAPYSSGLGQRVEINPNNTIYTGVTYKHYMNAYVSVECMALTDLANGIEFYGFFEYNGTIPDFPANLRWVAGGGGNVGTWAGFGDSYVMGIDGILGAEYTFSKIPLNISMDWKPIFNFVTAKPDSRFWPTKFGISARYTIKKPVAKPKAKK